MSTSHLLYEVAAGIATITLNRPEVLNAFSDEMRPSLLAQLETAEHDPAARVVVITGAGKAFCAGGDIANMVALQEANDSDKIKLRMGLGGAIVRKIRALPKPVIAAINGAAAGAGMNLALACDLRYASERAVFVQSFVKIGLVPDWAGHYLLTQVVGTARALEIMLLGDRLTVQEAARLGIVNQVFPEASFGAEVRSIAARLAAGPRRTMAEIKRGVYLGATDSLDAVLAHEREAQVGLFLMADAREGMRAFLEKRTPTFE